MKNPPRRGTAIGKDFQFVVTINGTDVNTELAGTGQWSRIAWFLVPCDVRSFITAAADHPGRELEAFEDAYTQYVQHEGGRSEHLLP